MRSLVEQLSAQNLDEKRGVLAVIMATIAMVVITLLHFSLPDTAARILLDRTGYLYPISVQNIMWIVFFVGMGEILVRVASSLVEEHQVSLGLLPEDERTVLMAGDLPQIYRKIRDSRDSKSCFLPRLLDRCILQFQASRSTEQSASLMNTSLEMFLHEVDLRYNMLRYMCWLIPSLGFIGTVVGIAQAMAVAGDPANADAPDMLTKVTSGLAVAFDTTLLALLMACVLVFFQNIVQSREERALNRAGQYCLDNLINRLYVDRQPTAAE